MSEDSKWLLGCPSPVCGTLADGFCNLGPMLADDRLANGRNGFTSKDSKLQIISNVTESDFDEYVERLKKAGMMGCQEHRLGHDKFFDFTFDGKYYHTSYQEKRGEIRVAENSEGISVMKFGYQKTGEQKTVIYQYALYYDPQNHVTDTTVNCGMLYIIKLSDNSLFMVDGGHIYQCSEEMIEGLWQFLLHITNTPVDGKIRIAGWHFTHAHDDHMDGCTKLLNRHHDQIILERVMFNFPCFRYVGGCAESTYRLKMAISTYYPQVKLLKLYAGQKFYLADMLVEVLYSQADAVEKEDLSQIQIRDFNGSSSILKLTIEGKSFIVLGDTNIETENILKRYSDKNVWKADMVQVAHHCFNYLDTLYEWISAPVALVPNSYFGAHTSDNIGKLAGVLKWVKNDQVYYEGQATDVFAAAEDGFRHIETYPLIGRPYDGSGF